MNDFRREICNDCVHGKVDGGNVTCALPNYLGIINDSIVTHRRYLHHYTAQANSDTTEQTPSKGTTVN